MAKKRKDETPEITENLVPSTLDDLMGDRFDIYAKDVIQDRAIPDARDGLKPVQRRIVFAMWKTGNTIDKPTKKCAHIVGEVMGKYHPHGDSSIYDALVRMSQTWRVRAPLIDFQGNNGSMDGDPAAAYRYTEARLAALSQELIRDIDKNTVDMGLTFDDTEFEPQVLPCHFPNLFVNGSSGIAVGMATEIPPHNLGEVTSAIIHRIQHPNCPIETLMRFVPGPDFPTGGIIYESQGLSDIYLTGRGKIDVASRTSIEEAEDGTSQIIITEIPYGVNKSQLVYAIDKLRHDKTIAGIDEVRDETDKSGLRIAVDIKEGFKPESILAYLMQKTQLRSSYTANMVAIVNGRPQVLNLLSYCDTYIAHQVDVETRRCQFDLKKDLARLEIVEGLIRASDLIDQIVRVIKRSRDKAESKVNIAAEFGFTEAQSEAIVMMPLYKLSNFDVETVLDEKKRLDLEIADLKETLRNPDKMNSLIISSLKAIVKRFDTPRRTAIEEEDVSMRSINQRDLVAKETVVVVVTRDGYIKRSSLASWRSSGGANGDFPGLKNGDTLIFDGQCDTTDWMLVFTSKGNFLYIPVHLIKANKWNDEGIHVNYAISLPAEEKLVRAFAVRKFRDDLFIALVSKKGQIKRTKLSSFQVSRFNRPIRAMRLLGDDEVVDVALTSGNSDLMIFSDTGLATFYNENEIAYSSTNSAGVKAASFRGGLVAGMLSFLPEESAKLLLVTQLGYTRVASSSNVTKTGRLNKATTLFKSFKNEPHFLVYAQKAPDVEPPYTLTATLSNGETASITYEDFYLTPMDKYAKGSSIKLPKGATVATIFTRDSTLIDDSMVSYHVEPVEENKEESPTSEVEDTAEQKSKGPEKFEQISIFGDEDF